MRSSLTRLALALLHAVYWLWTLCKSLSSRLRAAPSPPLHQRQKLPSHLALVLATGSSAVAEETKTAAFLESVDRALSWCRITGIQRLTVYDREGILSHTSDLQEHLAVHFESPTNPPPVEHKIQFPLTPPASDDGESRSSSPDGSCSRLVLDVVTIQFPMPAKTSVPPASTSVLRRRRSKRERHEKHRRPHSDHCDTTGKRFDAKPFILHVISRESSKPAIAKTAAALADTAEGSPLITFAQEDRTLAQKALNLLLEGQDGFPSPDLMIVHDISRRRLLKQPLELHGFPPWQIRLTEFYFDGSIRLAPWLLPGASARALPLEEIEFKRALDEFAAAEMRLGK